MSTPEPQSSRRVDPDPSVTEAVGRHHSLVSALADLVDNAIDAHAQHVLIRFLQREDMIDGLLVIDDGGGMDSATIDQAMTYARRREYGDQDLGHFGIGMKAASFSQADELYVWSKRHGAPYVGRGIQARSRTEGPVVDTYATEDATQRYRSFTAPFPRETGTVVEWREPRTFLRSRLTPEQTAWIEDQVADIRTHLGLVLHRILERGEVTITIDVLDEDAPYAAGIPRTVEPLDPFGNGGSGYPGYPTELGIDLPTGPTSLTLTIWPARNHGPAWSLGGRSPLDSQGLYVYRRDRLLQAGGWNGLAPPADDLSRARMRLEVSDAVDHLVTINPEKTGVQLDPTLVAAIQNGITPAGGTIRSYREDVRTGAREARKRSPRPITIPEPGTGVSARLREAFGDNADFTGAGPVDLKWGSMGEELVFDVDTENNCVWLNARYREALGGVPRGRNDDAPLAKTLLHVIVGRYAAGDRLGSKTKREIAAWNNVLLAAIEEYAGQVASGRGRRAAVTETRDYQ